jgi:hypothetical protein
MKQSMRIKECISVMNSSDWQTLILSPDGIHKKTRRVYVHKTQHAHNPRNSRRILHHNPARHLVVDEYPVAKKRPI